MTANPTRLRWALFSILVVTALAGFAWGERIELRWGHGWDGLWFGTWAQDPHRSILVEKVTSAEIQRILAPVIVHAGLRVFGVPLDAEEVELWSYSFRISPNVLRGFEVYHGALFVLLAFVWIRILDALELKPGTRILGCVALFANFAVLKEWFFNPISTDPTAMVLGAILLYAYLRDRSWGVLATTVIGAFSWPTIIYFGALLYAFPRASKPPDRVPAGRRTLLAGGSAVAMLAVLLYVYYATDVSPPNDEAPIVASLLPLTIALIVLWTFLVARSVADNRDLLKPATWLAQLRPGRLLLILAILVLSKLLFAYLSNDVAVHRGGSFTNFAHDVFRRGLVRPFQFVIPHVGYWGPIVWVTVFLWPRVYRHVAACGLGLVGFIAGHLLLSLNAESRQLVFAFPFFVAFTLKAADEIRWSPAFSWTFAGTALLLSRFWMPINPLEGPLLEFPMQRYMMNFGGWLSDRAFLMLAPPVLAVGLILAHYAHQAGLLSRRR